jgi:hypothetical protein
MSEFDAYNVHELREIADDPDLARMAEQTEGWRGMAWMFEAQLGRLETAAKALQTAWNSPAANRFLEEVGKVRQTLSAGQEKAAGNQKAWAAIAAKVETTRTEVKKIEKEYTDAWGTEKTNFEAAKKKDADSFNWAWGGLGDLWDDPDAPDENAFRKAYDERARTVMNNADVTYTTEYRQNLWTPPKYEGPQDATVPLDYDGSGTGKTTYPTGNGNGNGTHHLPKGQQPGPVHLPGDLPPGRLPDPILIVEPNGPGLDGGLVTIPPPTTLPPPTVTLPPPTTGILPPPIPPVLPPGMPPGRVPLPPGGSVPPRIPGGTRPPLLPTLPEGNTPVTGGRNVPGGRLPSGGRTPGMPEGSVVGDRGRGGGPRIPGGTEPPGGGRNVTGGRTTGERPGAGRGVTRPVDSVVGREPGSQGRTAGGRSTSGSARGGQVDADGVIRRRGNSTEQGSGHGPSGRRGKRRTEDDRTTPATPGSEEELWQVDDGVPAVTEPAAPYDGTGDQAGPHLGGSGRRR